MDVSAVGLAVRRRFPSTYDGVTPMPLLVAFHATSEGAGNVWFELSDGQPQASRYVIVTPQAPSSTPSTFEYHDPADLSAILDGLLTELCVDQRRMFAVGNGSGGRFLIDWIDHMARRDGPRFRAAAVVGTYYGRYLQGPLATLFIHGTNSRNSAAVSLDADGTKALAIFRTRNMCGEASTPVTVAVCARTGAPPNPGCVDFDDCAAPLRWCQTDDPVQSSAGDQWPCFAGAAIHEFFAR